MNVPFWVVSKHHLKMGLKIMVKPPAVLVMFINWTCTYSNLLFLEVSLVGALAIGFLRGGGDSPNVP